MITCPSLVAIEVIDSFLALNADFLFAPRAGIGSNNSYISADGQIVLDVALSFMSLGLPLSVNASGFMITRNQTINWHIRELNVSLFGDLFFSVGKQDVAWGLGDFYQPTFFLSSQSTLDLMRGDRSSYQWAINARYDTGLYTGDFYAIIDDNIEKFAIPQWVVTTAHNQLHFESMELFATAGYYYLNENSVNQHQMHLGVESEIFLFDLLGVDIHPLMGDWLKITTAFNNQIILTENIQYNLFFIANVALSDFTNPVAYQFVTEIIYDGTWWIGLLGRIEYEQIAVLTIFSIQLERTSDYTGEIIVTHIFNRYISHSISLGYQNTNSFSPWLVSYYIEISI